MFPSTSNIIGNNFLYSDNSNSFDSTNPYNFSSFPIHSPYGFYEDDLHEHLHDFLQYQQQQQQQAVPPIVAHQEIKSSTVITKMDQNRSHDIEHASTMNGLVQGSPTVTDDVVLCSTKKQIPRKRASNRDRHSKINTAHGPRDRRMRLSLDVAQKFFGLQDMLGFDKASKTVQWLLTKSKTAIKKLSSRSSTATTTTTTKGGVNVPNATSSSSTSNNSECEVLSGIIDELSAPSFSLPGTGKAKPAATAREKKATPPGRAAGPRAFRPIAKEAREKARARARERTEEKRSTRLGNVSVNFYDHRQSKKLPCIAGIDQSLNRNLASWVPFEAAGEAESSIQIQFGKEQHPLPFLQAHDHQEPTSTPRTTTSLMQHELQHINNANGGHSNLFTTEGNWNPSPAFNYHHNPAISHEDSFTEVEYFGKPWG